MLREQISHALSAFVCAVAIALSVWLVCANEAKAQSEVTVLAQNFKKLAPEEEIKLRAILAEPTNRRAQTNQLRQQIENKLQAAFKLSDAIAVFNANKEGTELFPNVPRYKNDLGAMYKFRGDIVTANFWYQEAFRTSTTDEQRAFYAASVANAFYLLGKDSDALAYAEKSIAFAQPTQRMDEDSLRDKARAQAYSWTTKAQLNMRQGQATAAVTDAEQAVNFARQATKFLKTVRGEAQKDFAYQQLLRSLQYKQNILLDTKKYSQAEAAMRDYLRLLEEVTMSPSNHASAINGVADYRYAQREFFQAEQLRADALTRFQKLNYEETNLAITSIRRDLAKALIGQHRYLDALAEFQKLDASAGIDEDLKARVRYALDRAVVYLYNNKALEALPLLASEAESLEKQYRQGLASNGQIRQHFFTAQASGLQGVALWRVGTPDSRAQAYPLLQAAVRNIMSPDNVDYLENVGIRKELREMIFSTYLEAASQVNSADAVAALGIADWLRGGLVQEALGDAAVRAAASNEALSGLVRQDQDARNEIKGLRNYLSGETGGAASPLPSVAAQMRERIALLERARAEVQVKIKATFPDYEKLVRPLPPSTTEIQARLKNDEALVVLQPTDEAVYVWALSKDGAGSFHRAAVSHAELSRLVKRLRVSLDVAGLPANRRPAFDHAAAQELYAKLLSPVQQGLAGKASLIIAAGGALGQIPFGVLETQPFDPSTDSGRAVSDASWLIKQAAVTHVPSVAAWLSMRSLPHKAAEQPMLAWGDPLFNIALASNAPHTEPALASVRKVVLTRAATAVDLEKEDPKSALKYADIPELPETRDELLAIAKTLGANAAKDLILGSAATRESVLAQNKNGNLAKQRVVAFATHGLMAGDLPNLTQPALAMAGTKDDAANVLAPLLTLEDVLTLKLNADWVVLSACNTAAADGKAEEALSGLARGFFYAGSRSLLVTHWAVDSESAMTLTTETFKNYQSKPTEAKAESLRQAMLTVMANPATAHPAYWAPYALVGDGGR